MKKIGVLGGGQLGRMLGSAGIELGFSFAFMDPNSQSPAFQIGTSFVSEFTPEKVLQFAQDLNYITYEFENIPLDVVRALETKNISVSPSSKSLEYTQNRTNEKQLFQKLGIKTGRWSPVSSYEDILNASEYIGDKLVLKAISSGYDGKGQLVIENVKCAEKEPIENFIRKTEAELSKNILVNQSLRGQPLFIAEEFIQFQRELSIISVRDVQGNILHYPLSENHHKEGILRTTIAPAPHTSSSIEQSAKKASERILEFLNHIGVLTVEFFEKDNELYANEIAPRVHNSGHWTLEGAYTSQFENHIRAIAGVPLGTTAPITVLQKNLIAAMINIIEEEPDVNQLLATKELSLHLYGKAPKKGRKLGHYTLIDDDLERLNERIRLTLKEAINK
jgi:5-(carboxyamino)imidazole ribonucleotide synthase